MTVLLTLAAVVLWAVTYSQPFNSGHGFTWTTVTGACDSSFTQGDASTQGNPSPSVFAECVGRNDLPEGRWQKTLTWESMGVTAGNIVTEVDGKFDHAIITRTHSSQPARGPLQIFDSGNTAACTASDLEPQTAYGSGTGSTAWATDDGTGAVSVNSGCQASSTSVTVRVGKRVNTGNNASATTRVNVDNIVLTITEQTPSGRKRAIIALLSPEGRVPNPGSVLRVQREEPERKE